MVKRGANYSSLQFTLGAVPSDADNLFTEQTEAREAVALTQRLAS